MSKSRRRRLYRKRKGEMWLRNFGYKWIAAGFLKTWEKYIKKLTGGQVTINVK